jgi:hypothetical protein
MLKEKKKINRKKGGRAYNNTSYVIEGKNMEFVIGLVNEEDKSDSKSRRLNQCIRFARKNEKLFREFLISEA